MTSGHRLVVVTPAGRRRYLEILARHVLACAQVDEWHLWQNTTDAADLSWMAALATTNPRVKLIAPAWPHEGNYSIHRYFTTATAPDTVYVRLDDDIVWCAPGAITRLAARRVADPGPFIMYGNVLNTGITSHLHQRARRLTKAHGFAGYACMDAVGWGNGAFAVDLHRTFLESALYRSALETVSDLGTRVQVVEKWWNLADWELSLYERHSINCISWLGSDCARWCREMDRDEEHWLSHVRPAQEKRPTLIVGSEVFVHYAFYSQRDEVEKHPEILDGYKKLAEAL